MLNLLFVFLFFTSLFAEEKITTHSIQLEGETLNYTASVVSGEVSYISYIKEGEDRPITFAFNGGPGSSSVLLHMGTFGPRRILSPEEGQSSLPPYKIVDNLETILDLTDIVFIDPLGTGLSKSDPEKGCYSINGDILSVANFIRDYLTANGRWNSPKYIAGESYGALRASGVADYLQFEFGINFNGLLLISPAIDYQTFIFNRDNPLPFFLYLPTYAATAWYHNRYLPEATLEEVVQKAREFAYNTYAPSLICRKCFDPEPIYETLSQMTSLPIDFIRRNQGRIADYQFFTELLADQNKMVGVYDARITAYSSDPIQAIVALYAGAFHTYLHKELNTPTSYTLFSSDVNGKWDYRDYNLWGYPNLMSGLRNALLNNPNMKVFVGCGYFDLATPFSTAEYCLDHLEIPHASIQIEYYEGGHMYYLNPSARVKFKEDLIRFYEGTP